MDRRANFDPGRNRITVSNRSPGASALHGSMMEWNRPVAAGYTAHDDITVETGQDV